MYLYNTFPLLASHSPHAKMQTLAHLHDCMHNKFAACREQNEPARQARQKKISCNDKHEHMDLVEMNMRYCKDCLLV